MQLYYFKVISSEFLLFVPSYLPVHVKNLFKIKVSPVRICFLVLTHFLIWCYKICHFIFSFTKIQFSSHHMYNSNNILHNIIVLMHFLLHTFYKEDKCTKALLRTEESKPEVSSKFCVEIKSSNISICFKTFGESFITEEVQRYTFLDMSTKYSYKVRL